MQFEYKMTVKYLPGYKACLMKDYRYAQSIALPQLVADFHKLRLPTPVKEFVTYDADGVISCSWRTDGERDKYNSRWNLEGKFPLSGKKLKNLSIEYVCLSVKELASLQRPPSPSTVPPALPVVPRKSGAVPRAPRALRGTTAMVSTPVPQEASTSHNLAMPSPSSTVPKVQPTALSPASSTGVSASRSEPFPKETGPMQHGTDNDDPDQNEETEIPFAREGPSDSATYENIASDDTTTLSLPGNKSLTSSYLSEEQLEAQLRVVRDRIARNMEEERRILTELHALGLTEFPKGNSLCEVKDLLVEEKRRRQVAEQRLEEIKLERRRPFIVPALLEAFELVCCASCDRRFIDTSSCLEETFETSSR